MHKELFHTKSHLRCFESVKRSGEHAARQVLFDSGANCCITPHEDDFNGHLEYINRGQMIDGLGKGLKVHGKGFVIWTFLDDGLTYRSLKLPCYYVPSSGIRIASIGEILRTYPDETVSLTDKELELSSSTETNSLTIPYCKESNLPIGTLQNPSVFNAQLDKNLRQVAQHKQGSLTGPKNANRSEPEKELLRWHERLGHISIRRVQCTFAIATYPCDFSLGISICFLNPIHVYTDHKNLTFEKYNSQRVVRWRMFLENYNPIFHWIKGENNTLADALSRLPFSERQSSDDNIFNSKNPQNIYQEYNPFADLASDGTDAHSFYSMATDNDNLFDCLVHLPDQAGTEFVLDYETIAEAQSRDVELQELAKTSPEKYPNVQMANDIKLRVYIADPKSQWKIYLPNELMTPAIEWYHLALSHVGSTRLYDTMSMHFYNAKLKNRAEDIISRCDTCQKHKQPGRGYGHAPPREAALLPWRDVAVDLIGPWTIDINGVKHKFSALTVIDMVTNLVEIKRIDNKSAHHVALQFENTWLARYPRPVNLIYDQGTEFTGYWFQRMIRRHKIKPHPITTKNPQANSVCERSHQAIGNALRVLSTLEPPAGSDGSTKTLDAAKALVDNAIANTIYAIRSTLTSATNTTPGGLAFHRDMILDLPIVADLQLIQENRQQLIDHRLIAANRKRFSYDYAVHDQVLKLVYKPDKLEPRAEGPYRIRTIHTNGTVTIRTGPYTIERINIRRIKPYKRSLTD